MLCSPEAAHSMPNYIPGSLGAKSCQHEYSLLDRLEGAALPRMALVALPSRQPC